MNQRGDNDTDDDGPFVCACGARHLSARAWSDHVRAQPAKSRRQHRLAAQPKAVMVDTGLPHPKPHVEPLPPRVAALADRQKVFRHRRDIGGVA